MQRTDKLGRKIPDFDRSAANKKGAQTRLAKDPDTFSKMGKAHRKKTGRGYFGKLKEEDPEALRKISSNRKAANNGEGEADGLRGSER